MENQFDIAKIIVAILVSALFIYCSIDPMDHGFIHMINFPIHEVGHILFKPLGNFIRVAGGTIFQFLIPIICCFDFFHRGQKFSAFIALMWIGQNFFDTAVYARDAIFMEIPLANLSGPINGKESHDWRYMLTHTNMLAHTDLIANIIVGMGIVTLTIAIIGAFYYARKTPIDFGDDD
jgi:hypothetical protein